MIIDEIAELAKIPEIEDYFADVLLDVKEKFRDKINTYRLKGNIKNVPPKDKPDQLGKEVITALSEAFEDNRTYFFELTRIQVPGKKSGFKWELEKFNLKSKAKRKIVGIIFDDFIKNADQYEITPHRLKDKIVDLPSLDKKLRINFSRSSPTRVVGFVKEYKEIEEKPVEKGKEEKAEQFVVRSNKNMLKLANTGENQLEMEKEELEKLLQYNPEFMDNVFFSIRMKQACDRL